MWAGDLEATAFETICNSICIFSQKRCTNLEATLLPSSDPTSIEGQGTRPLTHPNCPSKVLCKCLQLLVPFLTQASSSCRLTAMPQGQHKDRGSQTVPHTYTHRVFLPVTEPFYFAHKTTEDRTCEHLGDTMWLHLAPGPWEARREQ